MMEIQCLSFHPHTSGNARSTLKGLAAFRLSGPEIEIHDCPVHEHPDNGRQWVALPARPIVQDGQLVRNEQGRIEYASLLRFKSKDDYRAFSEAALRAIQDRELGISGNGELLI